MDAIELPQSETIGPCTVHTWLDENKGMRVYRTEVSTRDSVVGADLWSVAAGSLEEAAKNHAAGLIQAADVAIDLWLRTRDRNDQTPAHILEAARTLGIELAELESMRDTRADAGAEGGAQRRRALAAERIAEIRSR